MKVEVNVDIEGFGRIKKFGGDGNGLKNRGNDDNEDFEFSGIEKQSRLLQNALRGNPSSKKSQPNFGEDHV